MQKHHHSPKTKGSAIVTAVVITMAMALIIASLLSAALSERKMNHRSALRLEAKNAAETTIEFALAQIKDKFETRTNITTSALTSGADRLVIPAQSYYSGNVRYDSLAVLGGDIPSLSALTFIDPGVAANDQDPDKGKRVYARRITVLGSATVRDPAGGADIAAYARADLSVRDVPLFTHAIFYNLDLEIAPGPLMNIDGAVHTNGNLFVACQGSSGDSLNFRGTVTAAGHVYHAWKNPTSGKGGSHNTETLKEQPVNFMNAAGTMLNMKVGGVWKDSLMTPSSTEKSFSAYATNRWNGNLQTKDHGISTYAPPSFKDYKEDNPSTSSYDPVNSGHELIEPLLPTSSPAYNAEIEKQKMAAKAGLYIEINSTGTVKAKRKDGTVVTLPSGLIKSTPVYFKDYRRDPSGAKKVKTYELDMGKLKQAIESPTSTYQITGYNPATDWNGVVYVGFTSTAADLGFTGLRLINGKTGVSGSGVPSRGTDKGFTLATNNALYVKGHFNADGNIGTNSATVPETGEVPCALFGDSVTLLSTNWDDGVETKKPDAADTEVAAAIVTGIRPSGAKGLAEGSGGAHNLPRFLEDWGGKKNVIRGSLVCLYESEVDFTIWSVDYYAPPNRNWGFSQLFRDGTFPPGTPLLRSYWRSDYRELTATEYASALAGGP